VAVSALDYALDHQAGGFHGAPVVLLDGDEESLLPARHRPQRFVAARESLVDAKRDVTVFHVCVSGSRRLFTSGSGLFSLHGAGRLVAYQHQCCPE
jgi:hypothetical protein